MYVNFGICMLIALARIYVFLYLWRRKAKYEDDDNSDGNKKRKQRRPEIGIKIFVPDFSQQQVLHQSK